MGYFKLSSCLLALLSILPSTMATCPSGCSCTPNDRHVDCSGQDLTVLPDNIQENVISLNLSHNGIKNLDGRLTHFTHLRILDISSNQLDHIPTQLPLALWEFYAANNSIEELQKDDTAHQWNLKTLDVSNNLIERATLIKKTLIHLNFLNFSGNRFWTVPTNMPDKLITLDLSHNNLQNILPDTFHQDGLSKLYLNNNKFKSIPNGSFDQLTGLQLITLYGNLWECHSEQDIFYLLKWVKLIIATVLGCPCTEETICSKEGTSTMEPSTATLPSHTSAFTHHQTEITTLISTRHQETEGSTSHSSASQETGTTPFSQSVTNTSLNSPAPSSVSQPVSQVTTQNVTKQTMASTKRPWYTTSGRPSSATLPITTPEFTSDSKPVSQITQNITMHSMFSTERKWNTTSVTAKTSSRSSSSTMPITTPEFTSDSKPVSQITQNITMHSMFSTERKWNTTSVTAKTSSRSSSSTMPITAPEFTSNSIVLTNSTTVADSNGTVNSQTSGSVTPSTFEPMSSASHRPTASTASEPSTANPTTSQAATKSISSTSQTASTSLTTGSKIQETTETTSSTNQDMTTAPSTASKLHVCTGITLCLLVLTMLVLLLV
uniref:oligodendrocyte-myelin glycoprotein n=1 Tax=Pristiophorus japonicus TaxID=55135 RepID=UPI00398EF79C